VGCLDENTLQAFFERRLPEGEARGVEGHLADCATCRKLVAAFASMSGPANVTSPLGALGSAVVPLGTADILEQSPLGDAGDDTEERAQLGRRIARALAEKRVGTVLCGKWRVDRLVNIGGMAQVYAATHRNGRAVAIKVLRPELAVEPAFVQRFLREGYVANKVQHPGAVAILDDDMTPEGAPFLVMELLEGVTLAERLRASGPVSPREAARMGLEILGVLAAAHERGIVHRDVKPDNLFETKDGAIKVLDFGIARLRERALGGGSDTNTGMAMGTLGYMPPEHAKGVSAEIDARSDVWAVGATLYTLMTGKVLHDAPTTNAGLLLAMTQPIAPMRELAPEIPPAMGAVLDRALAFDRVERYPRCEAMIEALAGAREGEGAARAATGVTAVERRPRTMPRGWAIAAVAATGVAVLGGVLAMRSLGEPSATSTPTPTPTPTATATPTPTPTATAPAAATAPAPAPATAPAPAPAPASASAPASAPAHHKLPPRPAPSADPLGPRR
jgi:serine/threonine-protein kinase